MRKILLITAVCLLSASCVTGEGTLVVGSYNLRQDNPVDAEAGNGWQARRDAVAALVAYNDFDLFGAQEPFHNQVEDLAAALPQYAYLGVGRDDGKTAGEYSPIFYKKDKFTVVDWGTFWLSETPEVPSKGWGANYMRICTWALLENREDGFRFRVFNHHADHRSRQAQLEGTRLMLRRIDEAGHGEPVILMGDFNADENSPGYNLVHDSGLFGDCCELAAHRYTPAGTENHFKPSMNTVRRIDHIFVSRGWSVSRYAILADVYAARLETEEGATDYVFRFPSDHNAVRTELRYER